MISVLSRVAMNPVLFMGLTLVLSEGLNSGRPPKDGVEYLVLWAFFGMNDYMDNQCFVYIFTALPVIILSQIVNLTLALFWTLVQP